MKELKILADKQSEYLIDIQSRLPPKELLPSQGNETPTQSQPFMDHDEQENSPFSMISHQEEQEETPKKDLNVTSHSIQSTTVSKKKPVAPKKQLTKIEKVRPEEFAQVPKYMKGRLQLEKVNHTVQVVNNVLQKKYQTLKLPVTKLNNKQAHQVKIWKSTDNKETKDVFYFTEQDLADDGLKMDTAGTSLNGCSDCSSKSNIASLAAFEKAERNTRRWSCAICIKMRFHTLHQTIIHTDPSKIWILYVYSK